jgi:hypothetical protein
MLYVAIYMVLVPVPLRFTEPLLTNPTSDRRSSQKNIQAANKTFYALISEISSIVALQNQQEQTRNKGLSVPEAGELSSLIAVNEIQLLDCFPL